MATSGALSTSNQYVKYKITVTENSQSINANQTNVTVSVRFYRTNTGYTTYGSGTCYCKINGTTYTASITPSQKITSSGIVLFSMTLNIPHNTDGTKSLITSAWVSMNTPLTSSEQSYTQTLTTIARATTPTINVASVTLGGSITVSMPRASGSFTHTLRYSFGGASGTIGSNLATSRAWTVPLSLADRIPNSTSGVLTVFCDTYNSSAKIGTKSDTVMVNVPTTIVPSISDVAVTEATSGIATKFGAFVKNHSKLSVSVTASGDYSSTIISCITTACGNTYNGTRFTVDTVNLCDTVNLVTTVKDSRGRTASYTKTITVLDYAYPTITRLRATRCNQNGTANDEGEYLSIAYKLNITALNNRNDKSYTLAYKSANSDVYTTLTSGSVYSVDTTYVTTTTFNVDSAFTIKLTVSDYFKTVEHSVEVPTAFTLMDFNATGKGIAFGKVSEVNAMEIALPIYDAYGQQITNGLAIYESDDIDPNTSLDELILTDHVNAPGGGFWYIRSTFYQGKTASSNRSQIATPYNQDNAGIWYRYYYNGTWGAWESSVKDTGWINISLASGWSYTYEAERPKYRKIGDVVYLRGLVNATASAGVTITTLPVGYRPLGYFERFSCALNQTEQANIQANANGVLSDYTKGTSARTFLSLYGISYPIS